MNHVFVSYSRKDHETVDYIVARLNTDGLKIWLDRSAIKGGDLWRDEIVEAIDNAYACVLMLSPDSAASDNVRKEVDLAEGANKGLVPTLLVPVELPRKLRYQLAGIQWIEYYRDPEAKYGELLEALHAREPKDLAPETQMRREVEIVIKGIDASKFGPEEQQRLLNTIAEITGTPSTDIKLTALRAGSVHAFVNMPADAAYRLKTAALNREARLINYGIDGLRLTGDRYFVFLKTGRIAPLKSGGRWFSGGLGLMIALLLTAVIITVGLSLPNSFIPSFFATATATATNTFTSTPSSTSTATETLTSTPSLTLTPANTFTRTPTKTPTRTPTSTPSYTPTASPVPPTETFTATPNPPTTFSNPGASPNTFYGQYCSASWDQAVTIAAAVNDLSGVANVQIFFWLRSKASRTDFPVNSLPMTLKMTWFGSFWTRQINYGDIAGSYTYGEYWFQFYFVATDMVGAQTQSPVYLDRVTFSECAVIK
jgi:hypothetical protein